MRPNDIVRGAGVFDGQPLLEEVSLLNGFGSLRAAAAAANGTLPTAPADFISFFYMIFSIHVSEGDEGVLDFWLTVI